MYYTYVLISKCVKKTYAGHTSNIEERLVQHNQGRVNSSKKYKPYEVLILEEYSCLDLAKSRELYYKNFRGRQSIKAVLAKNMCKAAHH